MATSTLPFFTSKHTEAGKVSSASIASGSYSDYSVTFAESFSEVPSVILTLAANYNSVANAMGVVTQVCDEDEPTTSGFTIRVFNNTSATRTTNVHWVAFGD